MADIKTKYGASGQAVTITLTSLGNNNAQQSAAVDNSANQFLDALVSVVIAPAGSGVASTGFVAVYAYGTVDGGTTYSAGCSGSDAWFTGIKANLRFLGTVSCPSNGVTGIGTFSVANAFGGQLPQKWGIVVENVTGASLAASGSSVAYQGIMNEAV